MNDLKNGHISPECSRMHLQNLAKHLNSFNNLISVHEKGKTALLSIKVAQRSTE